MLFKPNTVVKVAYDMKRNKVYMVDVSTSKFYSHTKKFDYTNMSVPVGFVLAGIIREYYSRLRPQLYLNDFSDSLKILLIIIAVLASGGLLWILSKTRKEPQLEVYLQQYPQPEIVENTNIGLNKALPRAILTIIFTLGFLIGCLYMFNQFLIDSNLTSYILGTIFLFLFVSVITILRSAIFIIRLALEMA